MSGKSDEWYTPKRILDALPPMTLDPCSDESKATPCRMHYVLSEGNDGLDLNWRGRVWLNPPYSNTAKWLEKMSGEVESGRVQAVLALLPYRPEGYWHDYVWPSLVALGHFRRRVRFEHPRGVPAEGTGQFPSGLAFFGDRDLCMRLVFYVRMRLPTSEKMHWMFSDKPEEST